MNQLDALVDLGAVPGRPVLLLERDEVAIGPRARHQARIVEQHQREQPDRLRLLGHQLDDEPSEPDRLGAQLRSHQRFATGRTVALVEDQVDDGEHGGEPIRQHLGRRHLVRDAGVADLPLGAHESLRHRRLLDKERPRDLAGLEAGDRAQGERDLRVRGECRVAAGEDQPQPVVRERAVRGFAARVILGELVFQGGHPLERVALALQGLLTAQPVDRFAAAGGQDPRSRRPGDAFARPVFERGRKRVLERVLGELEVAAAGADQRRGQPAGVVAVDRLDSRLGGGIYRSPSHLRGGIHRSASRFSGGPGTVGLGSDGRAIGQRWSSRSRCERATR